MGITVRHGGDFGDAGKVLAQAIQAEENRQSQEEMAAKQRAVEMFNIKVKGAIASSQIQGANDRAHAANQARMDEAVLRAGLAEDMQRNEYVQSIETARREGRQKARAVDYVYTAEQRIKDANLTKAKAAINSSEYMTPEQKEAALMQVDISQLGNSEPVERLGDPNAPQFEEGFEPGTTHANAPDGSWTQGYSQVQSDGSKKMIVRPDQTPEYAADRAEEDRVKAEVVQQQKVRETELKRKQSLNDKKAASMEKIMTMKIDPEKGEKRMSFEQAKETVDRMYGDEERKAGIGGREERTTDWHVRAKERGMLVSDADLGLPPVVGEQVSLMRTLRHKYGDDPSQYPQSLRFLYANAAKTVRDYSRQPGGR